MSRLRRIVKRPEIKYTESTEPDIWAKHGFTETSGRGSSPPKEKKKSKLPKKPPSLPAELIAFPNRDKDWHESWASKPRKSQDLLNFPHPIRAVLCGPPNRGKTTAIKNIIARQWPPFERCVVIYPGGADSTREYDDLEGDDVEVLDDFPATEWWPSDKAGAKKTLCIVDDFEMKELNKVQRVSLDRLVGHVSTHRNVSVFLASQHFTNIPPIARRCANLYVLYKPTDMSSTRTISERVGHDLPTLFKSFAPRQHDSIWIDLTAKTPAPLRLNGYEIINDERDTNQDQQNYS